MMMLINLIPTNMKLFRKKAKKVEVTMDDLTAVQYAYVRLHYTYGERESQASMIALKNVERKLKSVLQPNL